MIGSSEGRIRAGSCTTFSFVCIAASIIGTLLVKAIGGTANVNSININ